MHKYLTLTFLVFLLSLYSVHAHATVVGELQGIVHDPQHRPIANAQVTIHAIDSQFMQTARTDQNGYFSFPTLPLGNYTVSISSSGFDLLQQTITAIPLSSFSFAAAYLGRSAFAGDPATLGSVDEFRIYNNAQTASAIAADYSAGANTVLPVPEPGSLAVMTLGAASILLWRRRTA